MNETKVKIERAYPQVRMLERPRSFAFEVYAWKIDYLLVPAKSGCTACKIKSGTITLPLSGLGYSKHTLAHLVAQELVAENI